MQTTGFILLLAAGVIILSGGDNGRVMDIPVIAAPKTGALISGVIR